MDIFIKFHNKLHILNIDPKCTIKTIKQKLNNINIKLYYSQILRDYHTIEHYNIKAGDTIHAFGSLKGGTGIPIMDVATDTTAVSDLGKNVFDISLVTTALSKWVADNERSFFQRLVEHITKITQFVKGMVTVAKFFPLITIVLMCLSALGRPLEFLLMIISLIFCTFMYVFYWGYFLIYFIYMLTNNNYEYFDRRIIKKYGFMSERAI